MNIQPTTLILYKSWMPDRKEQKASHSPTAIPTSKDREVLTAPLISAETSTYVNSVICQKLRCDGNKHVCIEPTLLQAEVQN